MKAANLPIFSEICWKTAKNAPFHIKSPVKNFHGRAKGGASHHGPPKYATVAVGVKIPMGIPMDMDMGMGIEMGLKFNHPGSPDWKPLGQQNAGEVWRNIVHVAVKAF